MKTNVLFMVLVLTLSPLAGGVSVADDKPPDLWSDECNYEYSAYSNGKSIANIYYCNASRFESLFTMALSGVGSEWIAVNNLHTNKWNHYSLLHEFGHNKLYYHKHGGIMGLAYNKTDIQKEKLNKTTIDIANSIDAFRVLTAGNFSDVSYMIDEYNSGDATFEQILQAIELYNSNSKKKRIWMDEIKNSTHMNNTANRYYRVENTRSVYLPKSELGDTT